MINKNNELINAIPDTCKNYSPTDKKIGIRSEKLGDIYVCQNLDGQGCLWCRNKTQLNGVLVNQRIG